MIASDMMKVLEMKAGEVEDSLVSPYMFFYRAMGQKEFDGLRKNDAFTVDPGGHQGIAYNPCYSADYMTNEGYAHMVELAITDGTDLVAELATPIYNVGRKSEAGTGSYGLGGTATPFIGNIRTKYGADLVNEMLATGRMTWRLVAFRFEHKLKLDE